MTDVAKILDRVARTLNQEVAPALEGRYLGGHAVMAGLLTAMAGEAFDGYVDRLMREIGAMAGLLADGGGAPGEVQPKSLRVPDVKAVHDRLSADLISLQERLEEDDADASRALNAKIWMFFAAAVEERAPTLPDFAAPADG